MKKYYFDKHEERIKELKEPILTKEDCPDLGCSYCIWYYNCPNADRSEENYLPDSAWDNIGYY